MTTIFIFGGIALVVLISVEYFIRKNATDTAGDLAGKVISSRTFGGAGLASNSPKSAKRIFYSGIVLILIDLLWAKLFGKGFLRFRGFVWLVVFLIVASIAAFARRSK